MNKTQIMIWLHGWGMSQDIWGELPHQLEGYHHEFLSYAQCANEEQMLAVLPERIDQLARTYPTTTLSISLIGWSFGGMLALDLLFNRRLPKQVELSAVVLVGTTPKFTSDDRSKGWSHNVLERMKRQLHSNPQKTLHDFTGAMLTNEEAALFAAICIKATQHTDFSLSGLEAGLTCLQNLDFREQLGEYFMANRNVTDNNKHRTRLFWMHGRDDMICPLGAWVDVPQDQLVVLDHVGHLPFLTQQARFLAYIRGIAYAN